MAPDGVLTFRLEFLAEGAALALSEDDSEAAAGFQREFNSLSTALGKHGQLFVWADGDEIREWVAFIPIRKANRYSMYRVKALMEQSSLFVLPSDQTADRDVVGYYRLDSRGLVLSSGPQVPPFALEKAPIINDADAVYRSDEGFLFPKWRTFVGNREFDRLDWKGRELNALKEGQLPQAISYFHPLFGSRESGK